MEKTLKFNSQIATSRVQSERLLALGLKKETADMEIEIFKGNNTISGYVSKGYWNNEISDALIELIPAWSLHRLLSLLPTEIKCDVENGLGIYLGSQNGVSYFGVLGYYSCENLYDAVILCIEDVIKEGYFNKDYLEGKK